MAEEITAVPAPERSSIAETGSITAHTARGNVHCITIVGQIEGHMELPAQGVHSAVALMHGFIQTVKVDQAVVRQEIVGSRHLFEVMDFRPFLIADAFPLGFLGFNIHHAPNGGGLRCALLRGVPAGSTLDGR